MLSFNNKILESGTSNILLIKDNKVYSPLKGIYRGITYKFFKQKLKKIINKNILINTLDSYDEIILIGSGKGVASIQTIRNIKWKRRSLKFYKKLSYIYNKEISKCLVYK
jgi:branched-subunit amino acid aminotransferase/4-amino-4-deoxychorismate lyase